MSNYSSYYRGASSKTIESSCDEEEAAPKKSAKGEPKASSAKSENSGATKSINEALKLALEKAAEEGVGDEEPEVLPALDSEGQGSDAKRTSSDDEFESKDSTDMTALPSHRPEDPQEEMDLADIPDFASYKERAKYIPLRLTYEERKSLRLVSAAIQVSDYTSNIDTAHKTKAKRHHNQLQHIVAFLTGLIASSDYDHGREVVEDRNFAKYESLLQSLLEVIRRYKITNPEKLRSEYGKLVYLMQDAVSPETQALLGVRIHKGIKTVYDVVRDGHALGLLEDRLLATATNEILPEKKSRQTIQSEIKRKEAAAEHLVKFYASSRLPADTIRACLYSIGDNNSFLNSNRKPVLDCIELLKEFFDPLRMEDGYSLAISEGTDGARLSHSHATQYAFVLQSLTLWAAILEDMFRLWYLAEEDLLSAAQSYELKNTGQGLQRVQQSPRVYKAMHEILVTTKASLGLDWIGSSVIHLGDHNVPNALVFIDKYTQVARILGPVVTTLRSLDALSADNEGLRRYLDAYGGLVKAKKDILCDFFTHAFDGSGGDNFFDAGSCIDGRLTSAWNWCSQLASKPYYPLFKLTGFLSFDGEFDK